MDFLFFIVLFGAFIVFLIPLLVILFLVQLNDRVKRLESNNSPQVSKVNLTSTSQTQEDQTQFSIIPEPTKTISRSTSEFNFLRWLAEDWVMKLGALLLTFGLGFLVSYAFIYDLISPSGRIVFGLILGIAIFAFGFKRLEKFPVQGDIFLSLGAFTLMISIIAGRTYIEFFSPLSALVSVFLTASSVSYISIVKDRKYLSYLGLLIGALAPILSFSPTPDSISLLSYLIILISGTIWVTRLKQVEGLTFIASIIFAVYTATLVSNRESFTINLVLVYIISFIFIINSIIEINQNKKNLVLDLITLAWSGFYLTIWINSMPISDSNSQDFRPILLLLTSIFFFFFGIYLYKKIKSSAAYYALTGVGSVMVYTSLTILLNSESWVLAFIAQVVTLSITTFLVTKDRKVCRGINLLLIFPMLGTLDVFFKEQNYYLSGYYPNEISSFFYALSLKDFLNLTSLTFAILGLGIFYYFQDKKTKSDDSLTFNKASIMVGSLYLFRLIWILSKELLAPRDGIGTQFDFSSLAALSIYTLIGIATYYYGLRNNALVSKRYGMILLTIVVLRVLFIEIFLMDLLTRIFTFLGIGTLLISTSFLGKRNK